MFIFECDFAKTYISFNYKIYKMYKVRDRMIVVKVFVPGNVISVISIYTPECGLDYS